MADLKGHPVVKLQSPTTQPLQETMMDILALLQWFNPTHSNINLRRVSRIVFALNGRVSMFGTSNSGALRNFDVDGIANPWEGDS